MFSERMVVSMMDSGGDVVTPVVNHASVDSRDCPPRPPVFVELGVLDGRRFVPGDVGEGVEVRDDSLSEADAWDEDDDESVLKAEIALRPSFVAEGFAHPCTAVYAHSKKNIDALRFVIAVSTPPYHRPSHRGDAPGKITVLSLALQSARFRSHLRRA